VEAMPATGSVDPEAAVAAEAVGGDLDRGSGEAPGSGEGRKLELPFELLNGAEATGAEVEIPTEWVLPELQQKKNWNTSNTARLVHVVMESRLRKFALAHQLNANRMELQAQQTPSDKFWTIVHWMYNVAYDVEWFAPTNEFLNIQAHVDKIDPSKRIQFRTVEVLKKQWGETKKRMNFMLKKYGESGGAEDVTLPDSNHTRFYNLSGQLHEGGKCGRPDRGYYYAFLMACKHVILQRFVEAVLDGHTRFSGNLLLPDGTAVLASFLDTSSTAAQDGSTAGAGTVAQQNSSSSMSSDGSAMSSGWKRKVKQACDDFRAFFGETRAKLERGCRETAAWHAMQVNQTSSLSDNINMMKGLHEQFMGLNGCISRTERSYQSWEFLQEELANVQAQIPVLRDEMRVQQTGNVAAARVCVAGAGGGGGPSPAQGRTLRMDSPSAAP